MTATALAPRRPRRAPVVPFDPSVRVEPFAGGITLRLPEPPSANRWWRMVTIKGQARMLLSSEARAYKQLVFATLDAHGVKPIAADAEVHVKIDWWRSRKSGDLDKRLGVVLDALQGAVYVNDAQITRLEAARHDSAGTSAIVVCVRWSGGQDSLL
jgi:Holliday junction resolvase RusA-like endonuclease